MELRRDRAIALIEKIRDSLICIQFDHMSLSTMDEIIGELSRLRQLFPWPCSDIDLAINYLEKMKRPRSDKFDLGQSILSAVVGIQVMAYRISTDIMDHRS
jgi:hypothetical protein